MEPTVIRFISLGCPKNYTDTQLLMGQFDNANYKILFENQEGSEDIVVINTCGFINDAREQSIDTIFHQIVRKISGEIKQIIVFGCFVQPYRDELIKELPEVDFFFGVDSLKEIVDAIKKKPTKFEHKRYLNKPNHYAYLKIADGCNRRCSFCAIPNIKGKHKSFSPEYIMEEAKMLADKGVKEIILISQELNSYGYDLKNGENISSLVEKLSDSNLFERIRLHYLYTNNFPARLIDLIAERDNISNYIDIRLQHVNENILKSMNRGGNEKSISELLDKFRKKIKNLSIRTTLIVGYPGETAKEFKQLYDFVKKQRFDRLGAFIFSKEENTPAYSLVDKTSHRTKLNRLDKLLELQSGISLQNNIDKIGNVYKVIIEREEDDFYIARTQYDSPDIDNEVYLRKTRKLKVGDFVNIKATKAYSFDIEGEIID
ncbi:MAG: 30S ribosomal protein S12 methylthiotransferase RimO [Lentimicrobiaceae bacterium]|nr:30S ribosomal protein S12 methylthiotransferase RimO [Lentimicrobiaceae bacterium]